jgi:hypothetical protein
MGETERDEGTASFCKLVGSVPCFVCEKELSWLYTISLAGVEPYF